jgi:EAL domain-containing protein (putative c-di-GMP-specific phosphodiesterase class I)/GGDEF domain-containing protein
MDPEREAALETLRTAYLKLRGALHDRTTDLPAYPVLFDDLRRALDARRRVGVIHAGVTNLDLIESLYGWQAFDRAIAQLAATVRALPGVEIPSSALLTVGGVPADRFVLFVPEDGRGRDVDEETLSALAAAVKARISRTLEDDAFHALAPRPQARVGHALLSENPFFRFERLVHAAVEEARALPDRRAARREEVWRAELSRVITDARIRTLWQPVVELDSGSFHGFEALARGPEDTPFATPRAMFALSGRAGIEADLDRVCRESALKDGPSVAGYGKIFVNVIPATLAERYTWSHAVPQVLRAAGRTPQDMVVEISERALGEDPSAHAEACAAVRAQGFALALDDVGTGRDGSAALSCLRPDYVKVDASVIRGIETSLIRQEIFSTIVRASAAIDAPIVGVGIESAEEAATLRSLGARFGQGYHFAQPAPRERWVT